MWRHGGIALVALAAICAESSSAPAARPAPLHDPVLVRIGMICRWDNRCMGQQLQAMSSALDFVQRKSPPQARIRTCNRNASRGPQRVDWVGFYNCIRNRRVGR